MNQPVFFLVNIADSVYIVLGFVIGQEKIAMDREKLEAITNWPPPSNVTELHGFLGLAKYLRKFMLDYATISIPLNAATGSKKKGAPIHMTGAQMEAFLKIQEMLISPPVLGMEVPKRPDEVITDASGLGIGAVLLQRDLFSSVAGSASFFQIK